MTHLVIREDRGPVTILTLNRPEKLNALSPALFVDLRTHLDAIETDTRIRCIVLKGAGRSFCAGADVEVLNAGVVTDDPEFRSKTVEYLGNVRPVLIAAVHGHCYTGGLELALTADVIVASRNATFRDTHARLGILPRWGLSARLPRRVGLTTARRISVTCEAIDADEALRIGLCDYVTPQDDLEKFAFGLADRVAENDPKAIAGVRELFARGLELPMSGALVHERDFSSTPIARTP